MFATATSDQEDYLETVSILADDYDRKQNPQPARSKPVEALRHLVEEHNLIAVLSVGFSEKMNHSGPRSSPDPAITVEHAVTLAKHFGVEPELFLDLR